MEKKKARRAWKKRRELITLEQRARSSERVVEALETLPELQGASIIMAFSPLPDEVDIYPLLGRLKRQGKTILFPVLVGEEGRMDAHATEDFGNDMKPSRFGLFEPANGIAADPRTIEFILVPAVAFNDRGHRLGRGGGYYDRFLAGRAPQAFRCGIAFECQVLKSIPVKEHDCAVHALVTEKHVRRFDTAANSSSRRR
ncbi:MAG: 5-formyltetrahydrofolate cyclo-ligase [Planctomycetota bacterium]